MSGNRADGRGALPRTPRLNRRRGLSVVVIYADDLGFGDVGCFGSEDIRTPHLDQLAADGARLTHWYSNSPVCSPSRASLLTGKYPVRAGVQEILGGRRGTVGLPEQPTLASQLRDAGYRTGIFGKWHLGTATGYGPLDRGFDTHTGFLAGCVDYYSHIFYWGEGNPVHDLWQDGEEIYDNGRYLTEVIAERAADFITETASQGDAPYFCYVPFNAPHYPMHAPRQYVDRFPELDPERRIMAAMVSALDDGVGRILAAIDAAGQRENTIVFFSSDNGPSTETRNWLNGEEIDYQGGSTGGFRGAKGSLFEGGIREPTIVRWPAVADSGQEITEPGLMMDLLPALLGAVGVPVPEDIDGVVPGWAGGSGAGERDLFWEYGPQLAVRRGRWKLVRSPREALGGPFVLDEMLIDLDADPAETTDLRAREPERTASLGAALDAWAESFGWDPSPWLPGSAG
ncbi:sulfatase family protein [Streptomyces endophyticus]|uniref:Sulfatase-like hydrolase/transferase n=1 Tax=Streptomyces endophyticus TaxID=714166 RepID=A0ABU6F5B2_9ACTN|nr:sulfatase-like hydrolase/transferase [Streptomyces endophyticus]MEB8338837.1 sulfatase-like hydrolase/transferase [Streptomyces endophyticus]